MKKLLARILGRDSWDLVEAQDFSKVSYEALHYVVRVAAAVGAVFAFIASYLMLKPELDSHFEDVVYTMYKHGRSIDVRPWQVAVSLSLCVASPLGAAVGAIGSYLIGYPLTRLFETLGAHMTSLDQ